MSTSDDANFWKAAQDKKKAEQVKKEPAPKRRWGKILLLAAGGVAIVIGGLVLLAPTIAGSLAPGLVASYSGDALNGTASIESASFSWSGPQVITGVKVVDKDKKSVLSVKDIQLSTGIIALATGNLDLGEITVSGVKANIVKSADGTTNLQRLPKGGGAAGSSGGSGGKGLGGSGGSGSAALPKGLRANLTVKNVGLSFVDETAKGEKGDPLSVSLDNFLVKAKVAPGEALKLEVSGDTSTNAGGNAGSIAVNAVVAHWSKDTGEITTNAATADATVDIKSLPIAILDAFAPGVIKGGSLRQALGDSANMTVTANGGLAGGKADFALITPNLNVKAKVGLADQIITSDGPVEVKITSKAIGGFVPGIESVLKQPDIEFAGLPDASLSIDNIRLAMPKDGAALDLRGSGAVIVANITEMKGSVRLQEGGAMEPFRISPMKATINAKDLAGAVRLTAATDAQVNGNSAGVLTADVTVEGVLDGKGAPVAGMPGNVKGDINVKGVATAIAQPFVQALKLNLKDDVGPTLDAHVTVASNLSAAGAKGTPPADVDITIQSQYLNASGGIRYSKERLSLKEGGFKLVARRPASMAGRFLDPALGYSLVGSRADAKGFTLTLKSLDVPMGSGGKPDAKTMVADAELSLEGVSLVPVIDGKPAAPVDIANLNLNMTVGGAAGAGGVRGSVASSIWHQSVPFSLAGTFNIAGLLINDASGNIGVAMDSMRPQADIQLKDVPVSIAVLANAGKPAPAPGSQPELDLVKLLKGVVGDSFTVALGANGVESTKGAYDVGIKMTSARVNADVNARGSQQSIDIKKFNAKATVTPETVRGLMATFAPEVVGAPQLASESTLTISVDPLSIPMANGKPNLAAAGQADLKIQLPGRTLVSGLSRMGPDGRPVDLGQVGVEEFNMTASAPIAALVGPAAPGKRAATVKLNGSLLGAAKSGVGAIGTFDMSVDTEVSNKALASALIAKLNLLNLNNGAIERIMGQPGKMTGALGDTTTVKVAADVQPPADAAGAAFDFAAATTNVSVTVDTPKLKSDGPLAATLAPDYIKVNKPSKFTLSVDSTWANAMLQPPATPGSAPVAAAVSIREITPVSLTIDKFRFPRKGAKGAAAQIEAAVALTIDKVTMQTADGKNLRLSGTNFTLDSQKAAANGAAGMKFALAVADVAVGEGAGASNMNVAGVIDGIIDASGNVDPSKAVVNVVADLPQIPTPLIDLFVKRDGTVVDALGPVAKLKLDVQRYPLSGIPAPGTQPPVIDLKASSNRASATLKGTIRDGMYVSIDPLKATVTEVTQQMSARYIKALPMLGTFEKKAEDQPAALEITNITAPLGNDLSKLNAEVVFDPGEARFGTSGVFSEILKAVQTRTTGQVGKKLEPLKVHVKNGIATYDRWTVPLGEFTVKTEGTIDLVQQYIDVVTYVPVSAVSDKALSALKIGGSLSKFIPGAVDALTEVPFRTKGPLANPKTEIDPEMILKNATKSLDPKNLKDTIGDLLKPKTPKSPK
jgi:hypothetical protein